MARRGSDQVLYQEAYFPIPIAETMTNVQQVFEYVLERIPSIRTEPGYILL